MLNVLRGDFGCVTFLAHGLPTRKGCGGLYKKLEAAAALGVWWWVWTGSVGRDGVKWLLRGVLYAWAILGMGLRDAFSTMYGTQRVSWYVWGSLDMMLVASGWNLWKWARMGAELRLRMLGECPFLSAMVFMSDLGAFSVCP